MRDELTKLTRHAAVYGLGRVLNKGISFLLIPLYTYYFTTADYGVMEILLAVSSIAGLVVALGLPSSLMRFYYSTEDPREQAEVVGTILTFLLVSGGALSATVFVSAESVSQWLLGTDQHALLVRLMAVQFFFLVSGDTGWVFLRARQRSGLYTALMQVSLLASAGLSVFFVAGRKMGVAGAFWGTAISAALLWVILMWLTVGKVGLRFSFTKLREMLHFGAPLIFTALTTFVMNYSDRFFLQRFSTLSEVGLYAVAYKFGFIVSLLGIQPILLIWEAQAYEIAKRKNAQQIFSRIFTFWSVVLISVSFPLSLFMREAFEIMVNVKFSAAYLMVPAIALAYVFHGISIYFEAGLLIQKKSRTIGAIGLLCIAVCLALNFALIPFWGRWGACLATVLSFATLAVATYYCSQRAYPIPCDLRAVVKVFVLAVLLVAVGWALPIESLVLRLVLKLVLLVVFAFALPRLGVLPTEEVSALRSLTLNWAQKQLVPGLRWAGWAGGAPEK